VPSPLSAHVARVCACGGTAPLGGPVANGRQAGGSGAHGAAGGEDGRASGETTASAPPPAAPARTDWYAPGQGRTVVVGGVEVVVRFVGRKGRRARIAITVPSDIAGFALQLTRLGATDTIAQQGVATHSRMP
jgi:hypothetical protein